MSNKFFLYSFLLILIFSNIAFGDDNVQKAEGALNHAATYHWLARYKNNDAHDLLKSKEYFSQALTLLIKSDTTHYAKSLRDRAQLGLADTDIRYDNCYDNINNEFPLFNILNGHNKIYELYDDPVVVAANYAVEDAIAVIPLPIKNDFQYDVIVLSEPINYELEDEIRVALNAYPQFFPRPIEDIIDVISRKEYEELYNKNFSQEILNKLSDKWNKNNLLIAKIINNDQINDVSYLGIYLYEWNTKNNAIVRSVYADGLAQDRTNYISDRMIWLSLLLLLTFIFTGISKKVFFFKEEKDRRPVYFWSGVYSFLITILSLYGIIYLFRVIAPVPTVLALVPQSLLWIFSFHIFIVTLPILIVYLIGIMTPKLNERLHDGETIAVLLCGVVTGLLYVLSSIYIMKFPEIKLYHYVTTMLIISCFYVAWVGHHLSLFFIKNKKYAITPLISIILILELSIYSIMSDNFNLLYIADCSLVLIPLLFHGSRRYSLYRNSQGKTNIIDDKQSELTLQKLRILINEPENFIDPSPKGDFVSGKINHFTQNFTSDGNNKLKVFLITGPQGSGKSRLAIQLAEKTIHEYNKNNPDGDGSNNWILFGDCDELNQSGSGVPFEPFSQALHKILGAGRFEPPAKKANKIKEGINSTGLGNILDVAGLGVLNMILGTQDEEVKSATTSEMVQIIIQTLVGLSKTRPVIFIIDDLHWIDPITNTLFENILSKLSSESTRNIFFIFTSRIEEETEAYSNANSIKYLRQCDNEEIIDLKEIVNGEFEYKNRFDELLIRSLHFNQYSAQRYLGYINSYDVSTILSFLQTIKSIIDQDGIEIIKNKVKIIRKFDFSRLRPPTDIINIINQQLQTLTDSQLQIIKFASFIGHEFKATILSEALRLGRMQVLYDLEILEEKNIIVDIRSQDDVYEFTSNAMINVVRYMAHIAENDKDEIPQIVREYHYRVAKSIQEKMKLQNLDISTLSNQDLYNLAKRSWASGDRMLFDAFDYNYEAIFRAFKQFRYEEAIVFGLNILDIIEKFEHTNKFQEILRVHLLVVQSKIILGSDAAGIDEMIEESKLIVDKAENLDKEQWNLIILNVEADAVIHDHSGFFEKQREEILAQIINEIDKSKSKYSFEMLYASLSQIRLDDDISHEKEFDKIKLLLEKVKNIDFNEEEQTETPLSGFSNDPTIDYKLLESEILEELIRMMFFMKLNSVDIIDYLKECEKIKSFREVNDKEGLALVYYNFGKCYSDIGDEEKANFYFNETINLGKKIGSDYYESQGRTGRGRIMLKNEDLDGALDEFRSVSKLRIWDDKEIQYQVYIGMLNISNLNNDSDLKEEYLSHAENLIQEDENKGYLCEELQVLISELS